MKQFETEYLAEDDSESPKNVLHREQGLSTQKSFQKQVNSLSDTIRNMGNPFVDDFPEFISLDSRNCVDPTVSEAMCSLESLGKQQYDQYVQDIITERTKSIHNPIKRNSPALFKRPKTKETSEILQYSTCGESNEYTNVKICNLCFFS